jgi:lipopolysaccharide transport system ATP-binding protein
MDTVINAEHVGKKYIIKHETGDRYKTFSGTLSNLGKKITSSVKASAKEDFWALEDINFEIKQGERVGIIGRNGAGKSTLLKVLSRIVTPTTGRIEITGRVASLLEVGTGFHPELSGRENIYLNGSILGMGKREIEKKFDEIVAFAEVERFLDTPVKRYSSGMYVRLAFAVAAHLEPEILIVDEVLAVGDAAFQKKCLGKMQDVSSNEGRTILFVSHNMGYISALCNKSMVLNKGHVDFFGDINQGIKIYNQRNVTTENRLIEKRKENQPVYVSDFNVTQNGAQLLFNLKVISNAAINDFHVGFGIDDELSRRLGTLFTRFYKTPLKIKEGENTICCEVSDFYLKPGKYKTDIFIGNSFEAYQHITDPVFFEVDFFEYYPSGMFPDESQGYLLPKQNWFTKNG